MKKLLFLSLLPFTAIAADPNFLTPADLPANALQYYATNGRGTIPEFPKGFGISEALEQNHARESCMAPVGKQLSDWSAESGQIAGNYWHYMISATFACLPPVTSANLRGDAASRLAKALVGVSELGGHKSADVLCYERIEDVCAGSTLEDLNDRETCELADKNQGGALSTIDDLVSDAHGDVLRNEGARSLNAALPVFTDGRRDDTPGGNCQPQLYGKFKGISRKSAHVNCSRDATGVDSCVVEGIIDN
jgi:hypothetical protein